MVTQSLHFSTNDAWLINHKIGLILNEIKRAKFVSIMHNA